MRKYEVLDLYNKRFKDERDQQECIEIHFLLQKCRWIQKYITDQNIVKEIASFAMGLCLECNLCHMEFGVIYETVVNEYDFIQYCRLHGVKSLNDKSIGYINDGLYYCPDCLLQKMEHQTNCGYCRYPVIDRSPFRGTVYHTYCKVQSTI